MIDNLILILHRVKHTRGSTSGSQGALTQAREAADMVLAQLADATPTPDDAHRAALALSEGNFGQFAAYLGDAYCAADRANRLRLVQAFTGIFGSGLQYANQCQINETSKL